MAKRVQVTLEDDVDGGEAADTIRFGLDGVDYEIDLSDANAGKLREAFAPWVSNGRRASGRRRGPSRPGMTRRGSRAGDIRSWAQGQGMEISARGRIPADIQEAYDRAH